MEEEKKKSKKNLKKDVEFIWNKEEKTCLSDEFFKLINKSAQPLETDQEK